MAAITRTTTVPESQLSTSPASTDPISAFFSTILQPGSSLHPTFLLVVDGAFLALVVTLLSVAFVTSWNIHLLALTGITLGLWGSIKWFVSELQKFKQAAPAGGENTLREKKAE